MVQRNNKGFLNCQSCSYNFVKQKDLDLIISKYGVTKWQKAKMYAETFKHISFKGFQDFKQDFSKYIQYSKKKQNLTKDQMQQFIRINNDIKKIGPLIIIQILPFSGPLFILYMYTYPGSIPSWFLIDYYHDKHEKLKIENQKKAITFFQNLNYQKIVLNELSLRELRKLSLLLFGYYRDGTIGYQKLFNKKISYLITQSFSKFLIKRQLKKQFERDEFSNIITRDMESLQEKIKWKIQKIMNGEYHFQYKPLYNQYEVKIQIDGMNKEAQIFKKVNQDQQLNEKQKINKTNQNNVNQTSKQTKKNNEK